MDRDLMRQVERLPRGAAAAAAVVITLALGGLERVSGGFSLGLFYAAPLALLVCNGWRSAAIGNGALIAAVRMAGAVAARGGAAPGFADIWNAAAFLAACEGFVLLLAALRNARRRLAEQALVDPATGLRNQKALLQRLAEEQQRVRRSCIPLTVSCIDVDGFPAVGRPRRRGNGSEVLRDISQALNASLRATDTVARLGDEEFALLLPETDEMQARVAIAKVRDRLAASVERWGGTLKASIGALTCNRPDLAPEAVLSTAGELMRYARTAGTEGVVERVLS